MKLFVYGTLLPTCSRFSVLQQLEAKFIVKDEILASMFSTNKEWPFIIVEPNNFKVVTGEVYELDDEKIVNIDRIEGYQKGRLDNLFERIEVTTIHANHKVVVYVGGQYLQNSVKNDPDTRRIEYGDWIAYIRMLEGYSRNTKEQQRRRQAFLDAHCAPSVC